MCFFRKKRVSEKVATDRDLVSANERAVEALLVLAENNEQLQGELKALKEKLKYLTPSEEGKILDFDKKIKNLIEDMRIALVKADGETNKKVENALTQIKLAIADRNAKM